VERPCSPSWRHRHFLHKKIELCHPIKNLSCTRHCGSQDLPEFCPLTHTSHAPAKVLHTYIMTLHKLLFKYSCSNTQISHFFKSKSGFFTHLSIVY
jgi:hypothetical protein